MPNIISNHQVKRDEIGRACATHGREDDFICRVLVGKPEGKNTTRRTKTCVGG
jgi:hypothetical protein